MAREPAWTLTDLAEHFGVSIGHIRGLAVHHALPNPRPLIYNPDTYYSNKVVSKNIQKRFKRSELIRWYQLHRKQ